MPVYEYTCPACDATFEKLRPISAAAEAASCPRCASNAPRAISLIARPFGSEASPFGALPMLGGGGGCGCGGACSCGHAMGA